MKQPRIKPQFNHIHVYSRNHIWQIDLVDFSKFSHWNRGYKYLLCAIDVYSRNSFAVPLKRKSDAHLGMGSILMKTKPVLIQSDNGTEFISREFQHVLNKHNVRPVKTVLDSPKAFQRALKAIYSCLCFFYFYHLIILYY